MGVAQAHVCQWLSGAKRPGLANRKMALARLKIPIEWWDEEIPSPHAPPPKPTAEWGERTAEARTRRLEDMVFSLFDKLEQERATMTMSEIARAARQIALADSEVRKLKGEGASELQVMRHPRWYELKKLILDALEEHPKALGDVIHVLEEAERRSA